MINADLAAGAGIYLEPRDQLRRLRGVGGHEHVFMRHVDRFAVGDHVLVLDANADPIKLVSKFPVGEGDAWIWISGEVKYQRLVELIQRLSATTIAPITITLEDPR